jgi:AcrR family transcriptional regulator
VSNGAPFRHFANREEILEAVALRVEELILKTIPDCSCPALDRIRQLFLARTKAMGHHAGIARLMFSDQLSLALPKPAANRLKNLVARTRSFLLEALNEAMDGGEIRSDLSPEALLPIVMGTLQHIVFARSLGLTKDGDTGDVSATLISLLAPCSLPHSRQE